MITDYEAKMLESIKSGKQPKGSRTKLKQNNFISRTKDDATLYLTFKGLKALRDFYKK